jgi:SAM-dependent methyltransferase
MNDEIAEQLNAINRNFYASVSEDFHATRGRSWPGWLRVLPHVTAPLRLLDVGCGNGRFGVFLAEHSLLPLVYLGLDSSAALLAHARDALAAFSSVQADLRLCDVIFDAIPDAPSDLVALFGILHHVPGSTRRQALMRACAERVVPGGLLVFACWRFYEFARFRERIVAWEPGFAVEAGDYLLDWRRGKRALRYCHYVDDAEHAELVRATGLEEIDSYRADGESGDVNRYSILRRPAQLSLRPTLA